LDSAMEPLHRRALHSPLQVVLLRRLLDRLHPLLRGQLFVPVRILLAGHLVEQPRHPAHPIRPHCRSQARRRLLPPAPPPPPAFAAVLPLRDELAAIEQVLGVEPDEEEHTRHLARYGELQEIYTRRGGYTLEATAKKIAFELGFRDPDLGRTVDTLSGGERGRV